MASTSDGATPAISRARRVAAERQVHAGLALPHVAALLDAGAGPDPLVAGVHDPGELVVGDDAVGHGEAGAEEAGAWHAPMYPPREVRERAGIACGATTQSDQIHPSHAMVIAHPMPRQVSHSRPIGVSHIGHQSSTRRRWRSTTWTAGKPACSSSTMPQQSRSGSTCHPGRLTRLQTMLVAPQPCWSLTPTTNFPVRRARSITLSRRARVSSFALGEALTISNPSMPAAARRIEPVPVIALVLRERCDGERLVQRVRVGEELQQPRPVPPVRPVHRVELPAQQNDVRPPRAHLAAAAERHRHVHRDQSRGGVVIGHEHGVEARALVPLAGSPSCRTIP